MFYVSALKNTPPESYITPLQKEAYAVLAELGIPFWRVDTDEAITMEDCVQIEAKLEAAMVKTLFLCNRQQSQFYLFVTRGDKPFRSREFSSALGVARLSFAPAEKMLEMLGTKIGAATVLSALNDPEGQVRVVFDRDVLAKEWMAISDGTTTGYLKVPVQRIYQDFLSFARHTPAAVEV